MFAMLFVGVGEVIGSIIIGQIIDKAGNKVTLIVLLISIAI